MSNLYEQIKDVVRPLIDAAKARVDDGTFGFYDVLATLREIVELAAVLCRKYETATRAEKREACIEAALDFFDQVIEPWDIPWVPDPVVDPKIREVIPLLVGMMVDWKADPLTTS